MPDMFTLVSLFRQGHIGRFVNAFSLTDSYLYLRISFQDAAMTAMCYAAARVFLQTLLLCRNQRSRLRGRVEMNFQNRGTEMEAECIFSARMGNLLAAILRLTIAVIRMRLANFRAEEKKYAAASH